MSFSFEAIGKNPPSILIIGGIFLALVGAVASFPVLLTLGVICIVLGVILQVLWLLLR